MKAMASGVALTTIAKEETSAFRGVVAAVTLVVEVITRVKKDMAVVGHVAVAAGTITIIIVAVVAAAALVNMAPVHGRSNGQTGDRVIPNVTLATTIRNRIAVVVITTMWKGDAEGVAVAVAVVLLT
ncbi:ATP-dependent RNA helicase UAP56/SUB2, partial [Trypanosoma cruzi]